MSCSFDFEGKPLGARCQRLTTPPGRNLALIRRLALAFGLSWLKA